MNRSGFVVKVKSKMIAEILEEFYDELFEELMASGSNMEIGPNTQVEIHMDDAYYDAPKDLMGILCYWLVLSTAVMYGTCTKQ